MMGVERELKELILSKYKSLREFSAIIDIPYTTLDSILKRGVNKAGITNIIKICSHFNISVDKLAEGKIIPIENVFTSTALTIQETTLLTKYRTLDENGRELVDGLLDTLYTQRFNKSTELSEETSAS